MPVAFLDFDGTIADSGPTIIGSARAALLQLGHPVPDADQLRRFVGPPLLEGITRVLGVPVAEADAFRLAYRAHYAEHMTDAVVYPGIPQMIDQLRAEGWVLAVATSKREDLVSRIIEAKGMSHLFAAVAGADLTEQNGGKAWVLARAVQLLADQGIDGSDGIMVGDRHHDVIGASAQGLRTIFVTWGYGPPIEAADAWAIAASPAEVVDRLRESLDA